MVDWDTPLPKYFPAIADMAPDDEMGLTDARILAAAGTRRGYRVDILPACRASTVGWRALNARALAASPFLDPAFFSALAETVDPKQVHVLTIRDGSDFDGVRAVWPFTVSDSPVPGMRGVVHSFATPYSPFAMPLIDRRDTKKVLLTAFETFAEIGALIVIPGVGLGTEIDQALRSAAGDRTIALANHASRPILTGGLSFDAYRAEHWSAQRRSSVKRQMRRLQRQGAVATVIHGADAPMADVASDFLALEAAGWKGQKGTALALRSDTAALFRTIAEDMGQSGLFEMHALTLNDRPLAMMAVFRIGDQAWTWKTAYDPEFARYSPGVLLMAEVTRNLLDDGVTLADSCSTNDTVVADPFWHNRVQSATMNIALSSVAGQATLAGALMAQRGRQLLKRGYHGARRLAGRKRAA